MANYLNCIPDAYHASIFEIPYEFYAEQGITTLFFDLDNTIIDYHETLIDDKRLDFLKGLAEKFKVLVISNSRESRVKPATQGLNFVALAMKPFKFGFKRALNQLNVEPKNVLMIGDQLLTDVQGAKKMGMKTVLVKAVARKTDKIWTKYNRLRERRIIDLIKKHEPKKYQEVILPYEANQ